MVHQMADQRERRTAAPLAASRVDWKVDLRVRQWAGC